MPATFTASDWLRRAAEIWTEAGAADNLHTKRLKIMLAQGCERIAHHIAAPMEAELISKANAGRPKPPPRERVLRGLVALLMTPFLLLTVLLIGCWLKASGELPVHRRMVFASGAINPCVMPALRRLPESRSAPLIDTAQFLNSITPSAT